MPRGTLYESEDNIHSAFSFVVEVVEDVWALIPDGTMPTAIPVVVVEAPASGAAKLLYQVLVVGTARLGPVSVVEPHLDSSNESDTVPLKKGDVLTLQVVGRVAEHRTGIEP
jgi:hypothetical protein